MIQYKRYIFSLFIFNCFCMLLPQNSTAEAMGRLFSRPAERSYLDVLRQNQKLKVVTPQQNMAADISEKAAPVILPAPITLQGYVKRSDGKSNTLWINNQVVQENSVVDDVRVGQLNQRGFSKKGASLEGVDVSVPANGRHVRLKAGQTYVPENNKIYEQQVIEKANNLALEQSGEISRGDE